VGYTTVVFSTPSTSSFDQKAFDEILNDVWNPEFYADVRIRNRQESSMLKFVVDSAASMSYISEMDAIKNLGYHRSDCQYTAKMGGLWKESIDFCVVQIEVVIDGEIYDSLALIGNHLTTQYNLLGRLKFFDYFQVNFQSRKKKVSFKKDVTAEEKKSIWTDEL